LGIRQNGKKYEVKEVKNPEKLEQDFTNTLRGEKFNIKILPKCFKYDFAEGTVLAFYIPLSNKKPIYFNTQSNTFIRTASGDQRATKEEIDGLYRDQAFGTQSSKVATGTSTAQIHTSSLQQYRQYLSRNNPAHTYNRLTDEEFLTKLRIVSDGQLTYSGLLFLGTNDAIQTIFPDFRIDYLEIPGTSYTNATARYTFRMDEQEDLWQYFFALFDRLRKQLDLPFKLTADGFASEDFPQLGALREALINLLMHTDYFSPGKARIRIFQDRLEFLNPGTLPESLERIMAEDLSLPRNPILAKLFRVARLAENAGYGFDKMIQGWQSYTNTTPEFEQGFNFTKATFWLKETEVTKKPEPGIEEEDWAQVRRKLEKKFGGSSEEVRRKFYN
jgi:ATP-dependent DNA helicase RecG